MGINYHPDQALPPNTPGAREDPIAASKDFEGDGIWLAPSASVQHIPSCKQTEQQTYKHISRKSWRACEKLTSHTP